MEKLDLQVSVARRLLPELTAQILETGQPRWRGALRRVPGLGRRFRYECADVIRRWEEEAVQWCDADARTVYTDLDEYHAAQNAAVFAAVRELVRAADA